MSWLPPNEWVFYDYVSAFTLTFTIFFWALMLIASILANIIASVRFKAPIDIPLEENSGAPFVTVLRPLCGIEYKLRENLESSFTQDYPHFELIMSLTDPKDECISIVQKLIEKYPLVDAKLVIDSSQNGINPKVSNLITPYREAKHDIVWVCDSNVFLNKGCLRRVIPLIQDPTVGLVHHLPLGISAHSFGGQLDAVFLNTTHAKMYTVINFFRLGPCVVGKSCIFRRSDLEEAGGLASFKDQLAEDQLIGTVVWNKGLRHVMATDLAYNRLGSLSTAGYFNRRSRWCRLRKFLVPGATLMEPFTESILNGLLAAYSFRYLFQIHPLNFFACHMIVWFLLDLQLSQRFSGKSLKGQDMRAFIVAWAFREISALPLYLYAVMGSTFIWRGHTYRITKGTRAVSDESSSHSLLHPVFHHPAFTRITSSLMTGIDFVADILIKSQRNGDTSSVESTAPKHSDFSLNKYPSKPDSPPFISYSTFDSCSSISSASSHEGIHDNFSLPDTEFPIKHSF